MWLMSIYRSCTFIALAVLFLQGCSKDSGNGTLSEITTDAILSVSVVGIEGEFEKATSGALMKLADMSGAQNHIVGADEAPMEVKLISNPDFDALLTVGSSENAAVPQVVKEAAVNGRSLDLRSAVTKAMTPGFKYYLIVRQKNSGQLIHSGEMTSGVDFKIDVTKGQTYIWTAYSYNNSSVPAPPSNLATATIPTGDGVDLLHATGEVTVSNPADPSAPIVMPLGIVFKHKLRRVMVELNTMGMFADLMTAEIELGGDYFHRGTMNVWTGNVSGSQLVTGKRTHTAHQAIEGHNYGDRRAFYFYTTQTGDINDFKVNLKRFKIQLDVAGQTREFTTPVVYTFAKLPAGTLGQSVSAKIELVESALTVNGVQWARSNLYFQVGHNGYRFSHMNTKTRAPETFFRAFTMRPGEGNRTAGDPCEMVYPQGLWKTPSATQLQALKNASAVVFGNYGTFVRFTPNNENTSTVYPHSKLHFNLNGRINGGLLGVLANNGEDRNAEIWSENRTVDLAGVANLGITYLEMENHQYGGVLGNSNTRERNVRTTLLADLGLLNITLLEAGGRRNVRCVRQ